MVELHSSDISAIKKLKMTDRKPLKKPALNVPNRDENFAGLVDSKMILKNPTASEQRSIEKLFRRKQARDKAV